MIINKARFSTVIGFLCYLWTSADNDPEIILLSTNSKSPDDYLKQITAVSGCIDIRIGDSNTVSEKKCPLIEEKLKDYLEGTIEDTGLKPLFLTGSEFEKKVWNAACSIPYGQTRSYSVIAGICGSPNASRAVGNALGKNPVMLIVPCHRIIKSDGSYGGFSAGPDLKKKLLELEGISYTT